MRTCLKCVIRQCYFKRVDATTRYYLNLLRRLDGQQIIYHVYLKCFGIILMLLSIIHKKIQMIQNRFYFIVKQLRLFFLRRSIWSKKRPPPSIPLKLAKVAKIQTLNANVFLIRVEIIKLQRVGQTSKSFEIYHQSVTC